MLRVSRAAGAWLARALPAWSGRRAGRSPAWWGAGAAGGAAMIVVLLFGGCGTPPVERDGPPLDGQRPAGEVAQEPVPRVEPPSRYGNAPTYIVDGRTYHTLATSEGFVQRGIASWYGRKFHGRRTSSGEVYDMYALTAAHRRLPLPTYARVTNLGNGRSIIVRINDRGPFHSNRIIDLSYGAAKRLGILGEGTGLVEVRAIDPRAPVPASRPGPEPVNIYLQVGAFADRQNAERLAHAVRKVSGRTATEIRSGTTGGRTLYRVRLGPLSDVETADSLSERLVGHGLADAIVVLDTPAAH